MIAHKWTIVVSVLVAASLGGRSVAQEVVPVPPAPFKGQIGLSAKGSKPDFPRPVHAPKDAPNVVLVLLDDVGFGASSTFGGPIDTPTLERLAKSRAARAPRGADLRRWPSLYAVPHHGALLVVARRPVRSTESPCPAQHTLSKTTLQGWPSCSPLAGTRIASCMISGICGTPASTLESPSDSLSTTTRRRSSSSATMARAYHEASVEEARAGDETASDASCSTMAGRPHAPGQPDAPRGPRRECPRCGLQRDCYLAAQYRRLVKRRGDKKAIVAVAHSILVIAYHLLRDGASYRELGGDYFDRLNADRLTRYHTKRLAALGYAVSLTKCAA